MSKPTGFAAMPPDRLHEISVMGGKALHEKNLAIGYKNSNHKSFTTMTPEERRAASSKGWKKSAEVRRRRREEQEEIDSGFTPRTPDCAHQGTLQNN